MVKILFILLSFITFSIAGGYGRIFASSNLQFVFANMIKNFYLKYPNDSVHVQYGSSGYLAKNILEGQRYDLFLSADMAYPNIIYKKGKALFPPKAYVRGFLVLAIPKNETIKDASIQCLSDKNIKIIIVSSAKTAPYGKASIDVLKNMKIYNKVKKKIKYTLDVGLVTDEVLWNKNIGFVPKSAIGLLSNNKINLITIDKKLYPPIIQGYVISKYGKNNKFAMDFLKFITSKEGKVIFEKYGYKIPYN